MIKTKYLLISLLISVCSLVAFKLTHSYFSDTEKILGNSVQVGVWGITPTEIPPGAPTPTPTEIIAPTPTETIPTNTPTPTPTVTPTPSSLANYIVISEIQIKGDNALQDFVELYNPTSNNVDISGWRLRKRTVNGSEDSLAVIPNGKSIQAHGFFLWANNDNGYSSSVGADVSNGNNISENNSIALLNSSSDTPIDQVAWGNGTGQFIEGTAIAQSPATNESFERKAYSTSNTASMMTGSDVIKGNAYDSNNNSNDFILRTTSQPQNSSSLTESP